MSDNVFTARSLQHVRAALVYGACAADAGTLLEYTHTLADAVKHAAHPLEPADVVCMRDATTPWMFDDTPYTLRADGVQFPVTAQDALDEVAALSWEIQHAPRRLTRGDLRAMRLRVMGILVTHDTLLSVRGNGALPSLSVHRRVCSVNEST